MDIALQVKKQIEVHSSQFTDKGQDHPISPKTPLSPLLQAIERVEVAPPGFINVFLSEGALSTKLAEVLKTGESYGTGASGKGKKLMVEYTDPNPFKEFHMGHLYSNAVGESLARLYEANGWNVIRSDYFGDVGMHVAKSVWGMKKQLSNPTNQTNLSNLQKKP